MGILKTLPFVILVIVASNFAYAQKYGAKTENLDIICRMNEKATREEAITFVKTSFTREQTIIFSVPVFFNTNSNYNKFQKIK